MPLRQNVLFGVSGNLAKLVFPKILPADAKIRNELVFCFANPISFQILQIFKENRIGKIKNELIPDLQNCRQDF